MPLLAYPNLAREPSHQKRFREEVVPWLQRERDDRQQLSEQWLRYANLYHGRHDQAGYRGRTQVYLKTARRIIENWVTKLKQDLFPHSGKWVAIESHTLEGEAEIPTLEALTKFYLQQGGFRRLMGPWLRTLVTLGTAPMDVGWRYSEEAVPTLQKIREGGRDIGVEETLRTITRYCGPTFRLVPPHRWYVSPSSANELESTVLQFEDVLLPLSRLTTMSKQEIAPSRPDLGHHVENLAKLTRDPAQGVTKTGARDNQDRFDAQRRLLRARGLKSPIDDASNPDPLVSVVKGFWKTILDEADGEVWYQFLIAGKDTLLQLRRVPFWHGQPSYLCGKFVEVEEEFYGYGVAGVIDSLQYFANDVMNQSGDALTWGLNPIVGVDPMAVQDPTTIRMKPGAKWLVRNPRESIAWMEPPKDSAMAGQAAVQQLIALMNDVANVAPYGGAGAQGRSKGRAVSTATGMQLIASEALVQVMDVMQTNEDLFFNPMLKRQYDLTIQCLETPLAVRVEGEHGASFVQRQITREHVIGDFSLRWIASAATFNQQVRAQQLIGFVQVLSRIPPEVFAQQNIRPNLKKILRDLYSIGFELPDADRVIEEATPVRARDPEIENEMFVAGRSDEVTVSPADDDKKHLDTHALLLGTGALPNPDAQTALVKHLESHLTAALAKQLMAQQQAMAGAGGMLGGGGVPGPGGPPAPSSNGSSPSGQLAMPQAPGRIASTTSQADVDRGLPRPTAGGPSGVM